MIGQHDSASADADRRSPSGHEAQSHGRRGAGDAGHRMMLGHPEAAVTASLGRLREFTGIVEGDASIGAFGDWSEVKN